MRDEHEDYERLIEMAEPIASEHPVYPSVLTEMGVIVKGITRRELFAAMAMQGYLSDTGECNQADVLSTIPRWSVELANALCAELDKGAEIEKTSISEKLMTAAGTDVKIGIRQYNCQHTSFTDVKFGEATCVNCRIVVPVTEME